MRLARLLVPALVPLALLAGCASSDDRQWMKPGQSYTQADFKRDVAACTRSGRLDDACMKERGWESVTPSKGPESAPQQRAPRY